MNGPLLLAACTLAVMFGSPFLVRRLRRRRPATHADDIAAPRPPVVIHADVTDARAFDSAFQIEPAPDREGGEER